MARRKDCYTDEEKDEIIAHVLVNVAAGKFVTRIFREDETTATGVKLPHRDTFWKWVFADETGELDRKLVHAREAGTEALLDEIVDIADEAAHDTTDKGMPRKEWMARSRLRVETRIKLAQLLKPRKYRDSVDLTSGGKPIGIGSAIEEAKRRLAALDRGGKDGNDQDGLD